MSQELKIETATVTIPIGPFVTSDGTAVTAFTLSAGDMLLSKVGGAYAAKNHPASAVHMSQGMFGMLLNSTDIGTLGRLDMKVQRTGGGVGKLPVWKELEIVTSAYWDIKGIADFGPAQASTVAGVAQASTIDGVAQASTLDTVNGQFPLSVVVGVAQASSLAVIDTNYAQASTVAGVGQASQVAVIKSYFPVSVVSAVTGGAQATILAAVAQATALADIGSVLDIVYAVWDRVLTGATHNVANSAGKRLRQIDAAFEVAAGTAQSGTATTITLATTESSISNIFDGDRVIITGGTGQREHNIITVYDGSTKIATLSKAWTVTPDDTSEYEILPANVDLQTWDHNAVTGDGDWSELQTDVDAIVAQHPLSAVIGVAQASTIAGVAQASQVVVTNSYFPVSVVATVTDGAQATTVAGVAQASTVIGVAQASSIAAIGPAKNVALSDFSFFMVKSTDHITPLTSVSPVGFIKKGSGSYASLTNAVAEVSSYGQFVVDFTQTEMNADILSFVFTAAGADQVGIVMITT